MCDWIYSEITTPFLWNVCAARTHFFIILWDLGKNLIWKSLPAQCVPGSKDCRQWGLFWVRAAWAWPSVWVLLVLVHTTQLDYPLSHSLLKCFTHLQCVGSSPVGPGTAHYGVGRGGRGGGGAQNRPLQGSTRKVSLSPLTTSRHCRTFWGREGVVWKNSKLGMWYTRLCFRLFTRRAMTLTIDKMC